MVAGILKPLQEHRRGPRNMPAHLCCDTLWKKQFQKTQRRLWRWSSFLMSVFCVSQRRLACVLGMFLTAVLWFFGIGRLGPRDGRGDRFLDGSGLLLSGFMTGLLGGVAPVMICCSQRGLLSWRRRWQTWYMEGPGPGTGGVASGGEEHWPAGGGDQPYLILDFVGRRAATATAMAYAFRYRDEDVVAPLCLPQVWGSRSMLAFVDPQQAWGDMMFDERQQQTGVGPRRKTMRGAKYDPRQALCG